jgi:hypothetical protein
LIFSFLPICFLRKKLVSISSCCSELTCDVERLRATGGKSVSWLSRTHKHRGGSVLLPHCSVAIQTLCGLVLYILSPLDFDLLLLLDDCVCVCLVWNLAYCEWTISRIR